MANDANSFENVDFDDILDTWCQKHPHGYRWEGESGVENFEQLTKDIGYDGIDNFLADNPGAVEALLEFISEHADNGGIEWKQALAENCDYTPTIEENDDAIIITEGNTVVIKPKTDDKQYAFIATAKYTPGTEIKNLIGLARTFEPTPVQQEIIDQIELELEADDAYSEEEQLNWKDQAEHQLRMLITELRNAWPTSQKCKELIKKHGLKELGF